MLPAQQVELVAQYESSRGPAVQQVRGSLIVSSLQTLRDLGLFERYLQHVPKARRDEILFALAASWLPVESALVHYGACEAMGLADDELDAIGRNVSNRIMSTFVGTLVRSSRDVTPGFVPLKQYPRLWDRLLVGGGCSVWSTGLKDARIESRGIPMFRQRYFRVAYMGVVRGAGLIFRKAVHTRMRKASDDTLVIDVSWV